MNKKFIGMEIKLNSIKVLIPLMVLWFSFIPSYHTKVQPSINSGLSEKGTSQIDRIQIKDIGKRYNSKRQTRVADSKENNSEVLMEWTPDSFSAQNIRIITVHVTQ